MLPPSGIALLSTRGFLTENAIDLATLAETSGANVSILTDNDISGYVIAHKVPTVPRIGIDFDTLYDLNIPSQELTELLEGEYYSPNEEHLKYAVDKMDLDEDTFEFLRNRRIEINAVKNTAGAEGLWNWIIKRLEEIYPNRNYNRAVNIPEPEEFIPPELQQLQDLIKGRIDNILHPEIERVEEELEYYEGFIEDIAEYEQEVFEKLENVLNGNGNGRSGNNTNNITTGVSTPDTRATKNWLKNITRDLAGLVKKYDGSNNKPGRVVN